MIRILNSNHLLETSDMLLGHFPVNLWAWGLMKWLRLIWLILLLPGRMMLQSVVSFVSPNLEALLFVWIPPRTQSGNSGFLTSAQAQSCAMPSHSICLSVKQFLVKFGGVVLFFSQIELLSCRLFSTRSAARSPSRSVWGQMRCPCVYSFPHSAVSWDLSGYFWFRGFCQNQP